MYLFAVSLGFPCQPVTFANYIIGKKAEQDNCKAGKEYFPRQRILLVECSFFNVTGMHKAGIIARYHHLGPC